jgi:hypothetical protein
MFTGMKHQIRCFTSQKLMLAGSPINVCNQGKIVGVTIIAGGDLIFDGQISVCSKSCNNDIRALCHYLIRPMIDHDIAPS